MHSVSLCLKSYIYKNFSRARHDFMLSLQTLELVQTKNYKSSHSIRFSFAGVLTWVIRIKQIILTKKLKCWKTKCISHLISFFQNLSVVFYQGYNTQPFLLVVIEHCKESRFRHCPLILMLHSTTLNNAINNILLIISYLCILCFVFYILLIRHINFILAGTCILYFMHIFYYDFVHMKLRATIQIQIHFFKSRDLSWDEN